MRIRTARPDDVATVWTLVRELADYENEAESAQATEEQIRSSLFDGAPRVFCDLAESDDGDVAGFAVWFFNYSTWTGTHGIYLEDLFVRPAFRGQGYGTALLQRLARECVEQGYHRLQWSVLDWNTPSIDYYRSLGAEPMGEWTVFRLTGDALRELAGRARG